MSAVIEVPPAIRQRLGGKAFSLIAAHAEQNENLAKRMARELEAAAAQMVSTSS
jgi:hypothetical protein